MPRPLPCNRCGSPCAVAEDMEVLADWGLAVVDDDGTVRPAEQHVEIDQTHGQPIRTRAICTNRQCQYQWTLRRRFEATALEG